MKKKIIFNITVWGELYIKSFKEITLQFLIKEIIENKDFYEKYEIKIEIWTFAKDIKNFEFINKINLFTTEIIQIDLIKKNYLKYYKKNKYNFLNIIQNFSITKNYHNSDYILFIYPDFIWSINSVKNVIRRMNNKDAVCVYCPQTIAENFIKPINYEKINEFILNNLHPIITNHSLSNKKIKFTTAASLSFVKKDLAIFKNIHLHPICIKLKKNINVLKKFYISLDEDFIVNCEFTKKNIYIPRNSKEMMFSSLLTRNFKTGLETPGNVTEKIIDWIGLHGSPLNFKFFKNTFYLSDNKKVNIKDLKYFNFFQKTNKIYKKIIKNFNSIKKIKTEDLIYDQEKSLDLYIINFLRFKKLVLSKISSIIDDKYSVMHDEIVFKKRFSINNHKKIKNNIFTFFLLKNIYNNFLKKYTK